MNLPTLDYPFSSARIHYATLGPRREMMLHMELWPHVNGKPVKWQGGDGDFINSRFGGIENYDEVTSFFGNWAENKNSSHELHWLRYALNKHSKPGNMFIEFVWDWTGDHFVIHCQNITITPVQTKNSPIEPDDQTYQSL